VRYVTRDGSAAGTICVGYSNFWVRVFREFKVPMDNTFAHFLHRHDKKKDHRAKLRGEESRRDTEVSVTVSLLSCTLPGVGTYDNSKQGLWSR